MQKPSFRAELLTRRTYCRPLEDGGHETWEDVCQRVIAHQENLWVLAKKAALTDKEQDELEELRELMLARKALPSGRILWMGGTKQAKKTSVAMFNCAFTTVRDVYSVVDAYYLLLNGCGVGFKPVPGLLSGFSRECEIEVVRSEGKYEKGDPYNFDKTDFEDGVWHLFVGDSGEAWAKALGKILAFKKSIKKIVLDFSEIRGSGLPLKGYGWLSSGDAQVAEAFSEICKILNKRAGQLLTEIDLLDIINLAGSTLTSRRSAQIALVDSTSPMAEEFAYAKKDHFTSNPWRSQSNNSLVYYSRPSKLELRGIFTQMMESGGSEPGLINGEAARKRAPWFAGVNPCGEILLSDGGLCNLVEIDLGKFIGDNQGLYDATRLIARANYRQTIVDLKDGVLSDRWHETQEYLRLCGVGVTGIVKWLSNLSKEESEDTLCMLRAVAIGSTHQIAGELDLPIPKAVTTVKPSGTLGKIMDTTEGLHKPLGRYIFNNIKFDANDDLVSELEDAGYKVIPDPYSSNNVIVTIPVDNGDMDWDVVDGTEVNQESAIDQLERYKLLMENYVDHNASITVSYQDHEVSEIVSWLYENWDVYVGVSFLPAVDPTKTAEDLGYPYLPQEVVSKDQYDSYISNLKEISIRGGELIATEECAGGSCPVR